MIPDLWYLAGAKELFAKFGAGRGFGEVAGNSYGNGCNFSSDHGHIYGDGYGYGNGNVYGSGIIYGYGDRYG